MTERGALLSLLTLDSEFSDYCLWESPDDEENEEVLQAWKDDLSAAGVEFRDVSSINGVELIWVMTLRQSFWLKYHRGWFDDFGKYRGLGGIAERMTWDHHHDPTASAVEYETELDHLWDAFLAAEGEKNNEVAL